MEAQANAKLGRFEGAERLLARALEIFAGVSDVSALTLITEVTVLLAVAREDRAAAGFLAGAAHRLKADTGVEIGDVRLNQFPQVEAFLSERDEALETAFQEGFASGLDDVIARARALLRS
jgi:hypothetical protein